MKKRLSSILALVLVVAMLASFAGCSKEVDPKEEIINGTKATLAALAAVGDQFGCGDIADMITSGPVHQELEVYLSDANLGMDLRDFYGSGIYMTADSSIPDRKMDIDMGLRIADYDALTLDMMCLDDTIYFACKELLEDHLLGITAEDIAEEYGMDENPFGVFEMAAGSIDEDGKHKLSDDTTAALKDAWTEFTEACTWENPEKKATISAGGESGECDFYTVTMPAEAIIDFVVSATDTLLSDEYIVAITESLEKYAGIYINKDGLREEMSEALTEPVEVEFAIKDKLLRHAETAITIEGETLEIELTFGMGKNVADYIELLIEVDGGTIELLSEGSHMLNEGVFDDNTVFSVNAPDEPGIIDVEMETEYDTKSGDYTWELDVYADGENFEFGGEGSLKIEKKTMDMVIDELYLDYMGMDAAVSGRYHISESQNVPVDVSNAKMLKDLTEDEIGELEVLLNENVYVLLMNIGRNVPAIGALIGF